MTEVMIGCHCLPSRFSKMVVGGKTDCFEKKGEPVQGTPSGSRGTKCGLRSPMSLDRANEMGAKYLGDP